MKGLSLDPELPTIGIDAPVPAFGLPKIPKLKKPQIKGLSLNPELPSISIDAPKPSFGLPKLPKAGIPPCPFKG